MKEFLRQAYNRVTYAVLKIVFFSSQDVEFFPDANGWSLTFRYKECVKKFFNLPFLFHPTNTFARFILFHEELRKRGVTEYVPQFRVSRFSVSYDYIPHSQNLMRAFFEESDANKRIRLLSEVFKMTDYFHAHGIIHGDLKPKNILVTPAGRLYAIDFENASVSNENKHKVEDYRKLIPRVIYLFTAAEIIQALERVTCSAELRAYVQGYLTSFDCRQLLSKVSNITFETETDVNGEDIDIRIPNEVTLVAIIDCFNISGLDHFLFYRSPEDVKVFAYNLSGIVELDIHLASPLPKPIFLYKKFIQFPAAQIAVTGPDGVGKTTLLEMFIKEKTDILVSRIPQRLVHASRIARHERGSSARFSLLERAFDRFSFSLFTRLVSYARLLQTNIAPIILLDRSFYDPFIQAKSTFGFRTVHFFKVFFPKHVTNILLVASPETVLHRKAQLSEAAIKLYYVRAEECLPCITFPAGDIKNIVPHFTAVFRYLVLTKKRFRL